MSEQADRDALAEVLGDMPEAVNVFDYTDEATRDNSGNVSETPTEPTQRRPILWSIPADDQDHPIGNGPVLHVDITPWGFGVRIWTEETGPTDGRPARVITDEQAIPENYEHLGSATTKNGAWHVYGATPNTTEEPT